MMGSQRDVPLEDILSEVLMLDAWPNAQRLCDLCAAYPQHGEEIVAFFEVWREQLKSDAPSPSPIEELEFSSDVTERGVAQALALLAEQKDPSFDRKRRARRVRLSNIVQSFGHDEAGFARACRLDENILGKLDRRRIQPSSEIPSLCFELMSDALAARAYAQSGNRSFRLALVHALQIAVSGAPLIPAGDLCSALIGRGGLTQSFAQAIQSSSLSEEEKQVWLKATGDAA